MSPHTCPGQCGRSVAHSRLACPDCWRRLPEAFQRGVTQAYASLRRNPADASRATAHRLAVTEALAWYRQNTGAESSFRRRKEAGTVASGTAVPAPTVCPVCDGDGVLGTVTQSWCPGCRCGICGKPTDMPPECKDCAAAEEGMAKRRADR